MLRWFRRHRDRTAASRRPRFDASVDIGPAAAVDAVRRRVRRIPGADWVSVEAHGGAAFGVRLFAAGTSERLPAAEAAELQALVEQEVRSALLEAPMPAGESTAWTVPEGMGAGFAETAAASPFAALEQLAALSQLVRGEPPPLPAPLPPPVRPAAEPAPVAIDIPDEDRADVGRLAALLGLVVPVDPTAQAAAAVRRLGSYAAVLAAPEAELRAVPGLGTHSVAAIKLVHAAAIRFARAGLAARPVLADRQRLNEYLAAALARERIEQFRILFLDRDGMLRADEVQARGTVNHTPVYPREVVRRALALEADAIVLVHNHPSGDPAPSRDDVEMTRTVREAAAVMKITLRDHIIVGNGRWLSFRDEGLLT